MMKPSESAYDVVPADAFAPNEKQARLRALIEFCKSIPADRFDIRGGDLEKGERGCVLDWYCARHPVPHYPTLLSGYGPDLDKAIDKAIYFGPNYVPYDDPIGQAAKDEFCRRIELLIPGS